MKTRIFEKKRVLSVLLALCMALALLPGAAMAAEAEEDAVMPLAEENDAVPPAEEDAAMPFAEEDDNTPPVVSGMYMDNPGQTVRPGNKLEFRVAVEDESGIDLSNSCLIFYRDESGWPNRHTLLARGVFYDEEAGLAYFELAITEDMRNGKYTLSGIDISDTCGNIAHYPIITSGNPDYADTGGIDFRTITFAIEGAIAPEGNPPAITALSMDRPGRTVRPGDTLEVYVSVEEESGIDMRRSFLDCGYTCEQGGYHDINSVETTFESGLSYGSYDARTKRATFNLCITDYMVNGTYTLLDVELRDIWDNYARYADYSDIPEEERPPWLYDRVNDLSKIAGYSSVRFTVTGSSYPDDHEPPTVHSVFMEEPGKTVTEGDTLTFYAFAEDANGVIASWSHLLFTYTDDQGLRHTAPARGVSYDAGTKLAEFEFEFPTSGHLINGTYKLTNVSICDICNNYTEFRAAGTWGPEDEGNEGDIDFEDVWFVIADPADPPPVDPGPDDPDPVDPGPGGPDSPPIYLPPHESSGGGTAAPKPEETPEPETPEEPPQPGTPAAPETPSYPVPAYTDIEPAAWYQEAASYVSARGLMTGTSATEFSPAANMTRAMVWTVLGRLDGADVSGSGEIWYENAQAWIRSKGVSDGSNPNGSVTREELVTMLWRYMGSPAAAADLDRFGDGASVSGWASGAVQWAVSAGLLEGSGGNLNPNGTATRAEVAAILMRFCENVIK